MKAANDLLYTAGIDDTLRAVDIATNSYTETATIKLDSQPRGLDIHGDIVVTASIRQVRRVPTILQDQLYPVKQCLLFILIPDKPYARRSKSR